MATYTTKYHLKKPALEDFGDIADINANMDIIDETLTNKADLGEDGKVPLEQLPELGSDLELGETSDTAYRGDRGKAAYDHSQITNGNPHGTTYSEVGAAPISHVTTQASPYVLGHIMIGTGFSVGSDGTMTLTAVDGGTF